jgi:RNA polymerase-binding transcription factor DksA
MMNARTTHLSAAELGARKAQLEARLAELTQRLTKIEDHLDDAPEKDWSEAAQAAENNEVLEGLGMAGAREIEAIHAALKRIETGTYGICVKTGEPIEAARLDLMPWTPVSGKAARG